MSELTKILEELYDAGTLIGDNQWSGDFSTLMTPLQAEKAVKACLLSVLPEKNNTEYGTDLIEYKRLGRNEVIDTIKKNAGIE